MVSYSIVGDSLARGSILQPGRILRVTVFWNQHTDVLADRTCGLVTKQELGRRMPGADRAVESEGDDGVGGMVPKCPGLVGLLPSNA